jgi:hypothetical protein
MSAIQDLIELNSKTAVIEYFKEKNVFHKYRYCPACALDGHQVRMKPDKRKDSIDNDAWRCSTCTKRIALRRDTFFETSKIAITTILQLIMYWIDFSPSTNPGHSPHTVRLQAENESAAKLSRFHILCFHHWLGMSKKS